MVCQDRRTQCRPHRRLSLPCRNTAFEVLWRSWSEHGFPVRECHTRPRTLIQQLYTRDARGNKTNTIETYVLSQRVAIASSDVYAVSDTARCGRRPDRRGHRTGIRVRRPSCSRSWTMSNLRCSPKPPPTPVQRGGTARLQLGQATLGLAPISASQGVFQITPAFSNETSSSGYNDTSSLNKVIKAVVTVEYADH